MIIIKICTEPGCDRLDSLRLHTQAIYTAEARLVTQMFGCRLVPAANSGAEFHGWWRGQAVVTVMGMRGSVGNDGRREREEKSRLDV